MRFDEQSVEMSRVGTFIIGAELTTVATAPTADRRYIRDTATTSTLVLEEVGLELALE